MAGHVGEVARLRDAFLVTGVELVGVGILVSTEQCRDLCDAVLPIHVHLVHCTSVMGILLVLNLDRIIDICSV